MTKSIPLTQGKFALVDDEDFEHLNQWKWHLHSAGYAASNEYVDAKHHKTIMMHRLILGTERGMDTDHINKNKLDNRRCNLRSATRSQNNSNRGKLVTNTSGYKGVTSVNGKWVAQIRKDKRQFYIGVYDNKKDAALAHDKLAREIFGEFADTNF